MVASGTQSAEWLHATSVPEVHAGAVQLGSLGAVWPMQTSHAASSQGLKQLVCKVHGVQFSSVSLPQELSMEPDPRYTLVVICPPMPSGTSSKQHPKQSQPLAASGSQTS